MRRSTALSLKHHSHTVAKLYSAFVRAVTRCAKVFDGEVRGINDNIKRLSRSSASRRMTPKKQRQQQLQKRNAGSLYYGGKCAASSRDDGVLPIPKSSLHSASLRSKISSYPAKTLSLSGCQVSPGTGLPGLRFRG